MSQILQTFKKLAAPVVFLLLVFLLVELSYRFYVLGLAGLDPIKANSMNTLMRSEYVQLAKNPEIFYELKPNQYGWYKGVRFWTNSEGQADREYARARPEGTFRIAVAGSSWEMPSGVEPGQAWHALLEEDANGSGKEAVEVINFGVEMYGLREIVGTVRHKIVEWNPDLILVAVTPYTMSLVWPADNQQQQLPPRAYPALQSYALLSLLQLAGLPSDAPVADRARLSDQQRPEQMAQLARAIKELGTNSAGIDVPVAVVFLGFYPFDDAVKVDIQSWAQQSGVSIIFANGIFPLDFEQMARYQVSLFDRHPNQAGHVLISDFVANALRAQNLLPLAAP